MLSVAVGVGEASAARRRVGVALGARLGADKPVGVAVLICEYAALGMARAIKLTIRANRIAVGSALRKALDIGFSLYTISLGRY
jgi:hypothetical protein